MMDIGADTLRKELQREAGIEPEYAALPRPERDAMRRSMMRSRPGNASTVAEESR